MKNVASLLGASSSSKGRTLPEPQCGQGGLGRALMG